MDKKFVCMCFYGQGGWGYWDIGLFITLGPKVLLFVRLKTLGTLNEF